MDRPYQANLIDAIRCEVKKGNRRILAVLPTGGGKGYLSARLIQECASKGNPSVFLAAQRELIFQIEKQLDRLDVGSNTLMNGVRNNVQGSQEHFDAKLCSLVAKDTLWSRAFKTAKVKLPPASLVQVDEAHGSLAQTYQAVLEAYGESVIVGWTATPCRADGRSLGNYYDSMVFGPTYKTLQEEGFLIPVTVFSPNSPDLKGLKSSGGDYAKGELQKRMNKDAMVGNIIDEWKANAGDRQTVVFAAGVEHSIHIRDDFRRLLGNDQVEHLDGKLSTDEREGIMGRVKDGRVRVLTNYGVAHTGVDVPAWKYLICARPTKSFGLWRQMGGRIQRPFGDYIDAIIQDHTDNAIHFGYPDEDVEWELSGDEKIQDLHAANRKASGNEPPVRCPKCHRVITGTKCRNCGTKREPVGEAVDMAPGKLQELARKKLNRNASKETKQEFWGECLGWAIGTNSKIGAAAHRYKQKFGVFPRDLRDLPKGSEWQMRGKDFYNEVLKPAKSSSDATAKREFEEAFGG